LCWEVWDFPRINKRKPKVLRGKPLTLKNVRKGSRGRILGQRKISKRRKAPSRRKIQTRRRVLSRRRIPKQKRRILTLPRSIVRRWK
jgi:hypothetical protein